MYHGESTTPRSLNALGYSPSPGEFGSAGFESKPGNPYARSFANKLDIGHHHMPVSPRVHVDNLGKQLQHGQAFQSNWNPTTGAEIREMPMDVSFPGEYCIEVARISYPFPYILTSSTLSMIDD